MKEYDLGESKGKFDNVYISIKEWRKIEKSLKALEIIKEKRVDVVILFNSPSLTLYNTILVIRNESEYELTQEEYDLLKEVLL